MELTTKIPQAHQGPVYDIDFASPQFDSIICSCGFDKCVYLWKNNMNSYSKVFEYKDHTNVVTSISFSHELKDMLLFVSCCLDGNIAIHQYKNGTFVSQKIQAHTNGATSVSFNPTKPMNFITCGNDYYIKVWTYVTEEDNWISETLDKSESAVKDIAYKPNDTNDTFVSCNEEGEVLLWTKKNDGKWESSSLLSHSCGIEKVSWNSNGNAMIVVSSNGEEILINEDVFNTK
jgi:protein transport protein SEC13